MEGTARTSVRPSTHTSPPPSPADVAAPTEPLSARGLDVLCRLETELAWAER